MRDDEATRPANGFVPPSFDGWSLADLREHIAALKADIARAEATTAARQASIGAADAFFRKT